MNSFEDFGEADRQSIIQSTGTGTWQQTAEQLADLVMRLRTANERAIGWLDCGAPRNAREELEATRD